MKFLLFTAAFIVCALASAQKQILRYEPPSFGRTGTSLITDSSTNSIYFITTHREFIERIRLSPKGQENLLHQGLVPNESFITNYQLDEKMQRLFADNKYIDACVTGAKMIELLQHQWNYSDLLFVETDLASGRSTSTDTLRMQWAGDLLFTYRKSKALCAVEKPKSKPYFLFHEKVFGHPVKTDTVKIEMPNIGRIDAKIFGSSADNFNEINFGSDVQVLPNNLWLPVFSIKSRNKAFVQKDKFYVVLNADNLQTWLLTLDLYSLQYSIKKFDSPVSDVKNRQSLSNAALVVDSFLITGFCNDKNIYCNVYNIRTDSLLQKIIINSQNFDAVSAGAPVKVGDFWSRSNVSEISLKEFTDKAAENQLIIDGFREGEELFLTFGSPYKIWVSATMLGNLATAGMGGFAQTKPPSTVYFHTSWRLPSFAATKKPAKELVWDKMLNHLFAARQTGGFNMNYMNGFYYIGYFNAANRDYQLYRFDEKME